MKIKEYKVSKEIKDMFEDMQSYFDCRDSAIKNVFGWKRAAYFAKRGNQVRAEAWKTVTALYPELEGIKCHYDYTSDSVKINIRQKE